MKYIGFPRPSYPLALIIKPALYHTANIYGRKIAKFRQISKT